MMRRALLLLAAAAALPAAAEPVLQPYQGIPTAAGVVTVRCAAAGGTFAYAVNGVVALTRGRCAPGATARLQRTGAERQFALFTGHGFSDLYLEEPGAAGRDGHVAIRFKIYGPPTVLDYSTAVPEIVYVTDDVAELRFPPAGQPEGPWQCAAQFDWSQARITGIRPMPDGPLRTNAESCARRFKGLVATRAR